MREELEKRVELQQRVAELERDLDDLGSQAGRDIADLKEALQAAELRASKARAEGMEEAARIARDHTPEKHELTLAAHVTGRAIERAIRARAALSPDRK